DFFFFFFSSRRRHTRCLSDWSSDVCSSDLDDRFPLEPWKPVVGENLFMRESGAVASQFHIPEAIEPFSADLVGANREIVLGKKSGIDSIAIKAKELGIPLTAEQQQAVLAAVKRLGVEKRGLLTDAEFRSLVDRVQNPVA